MNTYIALFRGINVGGNNLLPMKALAQTLEGMGFKDIRTYIQSGNVVFRARKQAPAKLAKAISANISSEYGFEPRVLILEAADLQAAINQNPFDTEVGKALHCYFLDEKPSKPNLEKINTLRAGSEDFLLKDKVFYLYAPDGVGRSKLAAAVETCLGVPATARNWNTVSKLMAMAQE